MPSHQRGQASTLSVFFLVVTLATAWILWSGLYKPLLLGLGLFSCLLSAYLAHRMGFFRHVALFRFLPRLPGYWWWLFKEIVVSSCRVARIILTPSLPISPTVVTMEADNHSEVGQVILGNSITLSPGTVTMDVHEGKLMVHCLTREGARELERGEAKRLAAALERP